MKKKSREPENQRPDCKDPKPGPSEKDFQDRKCRARLLALLENTDDCVMIADEKGVPAQFNSAYANLVEELLGVKMKPGLQPHKMLKEPEKVKFWEQLHQRALKGEKFRAEYRHRINDKQFRFFEHSFCPIFDGMTVIGFTETTRDLTERRQIEESLWEKKETYRILLKRTEKDLYELFQNATVGIFVISREGDLITVNPKCAEIFGYESVKQLLEKVDNAARFYADPNQRKELVERLDREGSLKNVIVKGRKQNGDTIWLIVNALKRTRNGSVIYEGFLQDITERHKVAEALRKSEEDLRSIIENASGFAIYRMANDKSSPFKLKLVFASPSIEEILGIAPEKLTVEEMFKKTHPRDLDAVAKAHERAFSTGRFDETFRFFNDKKNDWVYIAVISTGIHDKHGNLTHVNGIIVDVTARKTAEERLKTREWELNVKARRLQDANTALNVLLEKREKDKKNLEENIVYNINKLVFPFLDKIDKSKLDGRQRALCETVRSNLAEITSAFSNRLSSSYIGLTPGEIQVASLIKQGFKTKEIADCLNCSYKTIESHRENIREKIGIKKKKVNLRTYLMALE